MAMSSVQQAPISFGAEAAGDEFGGVVEGAQALARLQDEHASERPGPVHHGGRRGWKGAVKGLPSPTRLSLAPAREVPTFLVV